MPISRITVIKADGSSQNLDTRLALAVKNDPLVAGSSLDSMAVDGSVATVNMPTLVDTVYQQAVNRLVEAGKGWLRSVNGVTTDTCALLIGGDACFSWIPGDENVRTYITKERGQNGQAVIKSYLLVKGGGMHVLNMCAACGSCKPQARLRMLLENLKMQLNLQKDKNLYDDTLLNQRLAVLRQNVMDPDASCDIPSRSWPQQAYSGTQLLGQVVTCLHMWNYIAARAYAKSVVETAAQDPAAFVIRTKRAFPSCYNSTTQEGTPGTIKCEIEIKRVSGGSDSPSTTSADISVYIPECTTEFQPFANANIGGHDATVTYYNNDATHKKITTSTWQVSKSGTYMLSAYVLPFHYAELKDSNGNALSLDNVNLNPTGTPTTVTDATDGKVYNARQFNATQATITQAVKYNTNGSDGLNWYNNSKTFPSKTADGLFTWSVQITWTMTGVNGASEAATSTPVSYVENFLIQTRKPRKPVLDLFPLTKIYDVAPRGSL